MRVVNSRAAAGHFDMPPAFERRQEHEEIGGGGFNTSDISDVSWSFVFVIGSRETSRFHRDRLPRIGNQLLRGFIKTDQRNIAIARAQINRQHVLHRGYERAVLLRRNDPLLLEMRLKPVFFKTRPIVLSLA